MKTQIITTSALVAKDGKILIAKRAETKSFRPGGWELPGGSVEFGEPAQEAVKRELKEELSIDIEVGEPAFCFSYVPEPKLHAIEVDFFATMVNPNQEIRLNKKDHSDFKWITEEEIETHFPPEDGNGKAVRKGFELLKK